MLIGSIIALPTRTAERAGDRYWSPGLAFDAGHAGGADECSVNRARCELQALARSQFEAFAARDVEADGTLDAIEDLAVGVGVRWVRVTGTIRPGVAAARLRFEPAQEIV